MLLCSCGWLRRMVLVYSTVSPSLYWGIRTHTDHRVSTEHPLLSTSSSSNLVFPGGLPSRYWPGSTLLSFSGRPVLGYRVIWLLAICSCGWLTCQGVAMQLWVVAMVLLCSYEWLPGCCYSAMGSCHGIAMQLWVVARVLLCSYG